MKFNFSIVSGSKNNSSKILSDLDSLEKIANRSNIVLMTIGVFINSVCIFIFLQKELLRRKFNWFLLVLSVCELIFCLVLSIDFIFKEVSTQAIKLHHLNEFTKIAFNFTIHTLDSYGVILTLLFTIDRFYAFKNPLQIKDFITNLHAKALIGLSYVVLLLLKIPSFVFCEKKSNSNTPSIIIFCTLVSPLIFNLIPILVILILNSLLIMSIVKYNKGEIAVTISLATNQITYLRKNSSACNTLVSTNSKLSSKQKSHYLVILVTALWSFCTSTPYYILSTYLFLFTVNFFSIFSYLNTVILLQILFALLFNLSHCINFFTYLGFHKEFKDCFLKVFFSRKN